MQLTIKNLRKPVLFLVGALALYALLGFLILPAGLKAKLPGLIEQETGRKAAIEHIAFNPFSLELAVQGFTMQETDDRLFAGFDNFAANIAVLDSIRHWGLVVDQLRLDKPFFRIAKNQAGVFNFSELLPPETTPPQKDSETPFPFLIRQLNIAEGTCLWQNFYFKKPKQETCASINVSLSDLSTLGTTPASLHLDMTFASGAHLTWTGEAHLQPLQSKGSIKLDKLDLPKIWQIFLQGNAPFKIPNGVATFVTEYEFNDKDRVNHLTLSAAQLKLDHLKLAETEAAAFPDISADSISLSADYAIDYDGQTTRIAINQGQFASSAFSVSGSKNSPGIPDVSADSMTLSANYAIELDGQSTRIAINQGQFSASAISVAGTQNSPGIPAIKLKKIDLGADTRLSSDDQGLQFVVDKATIDLSHFALSEQNNKDKLIEIGHVAVKGIHADSAKQQLDIATVTTENAHIKAWLDAAGVINYKTLFSTPATPQPAGRPEAQAPWNLVIGKVAVKNYQVNFTDRTQAKPVAVDTTGLNVELENLSTRPGAKVPLKLSARVNGGGAIKLSGTGVLSPLAVNLAVDIDAIDLKTAQPYLEKYVRLELLDGDLSTQGQLSVEQEKGAEPALKYQGNAKIAQLLTRDNLQHKDFVKWDSLNLGKIAVDLQQQTFSLDDVVFEKPYIRIVIKKDSTTNIQDILIEQASSAKTAAQKPTAASGLKPEFSIGTIKVEQGRSDYADYSLILPFITQMDKLDGLLSGVSSKQNATAKLSLKGKVYDLASVDITGKYQINTGDSDVKLKFKNMPLPLMTPYMAEFAGYKIEKGQMSLDLGYTIDNGKLKAQNNLFIDQFTLGEKVENPRAVSLPLKLAVALLKDSNGKINLDLPISGSLNDPEFSISSLVFKALGNLISKVVRSPFQVIASLVDGGEDLSEISFSPGSADLDETEQDKLNELAKALQKRPALRLEIKGAAFEEQDWPAMRFDALKDQLKKMKVKALKAKGTKIRAEYTDLSEKDYKELLAQLFIEKFPLLAEYSFFGTPQLKNPEEGDFYEIARQKLEAIIEPETQRLKALALSRAANIAKYMTEQSQIASDRVFILAPEMNPERDKKGISVSLSLAVAS